MIQIKSNMDDIIPYDKFVFPGGEVSVKINSPYNYLVGIKIHAKLENANDIMELLLLTDACKRQFNTTNIELTIPYLPYARQDRICNTGESLALKVMCDLINAQHYTKVTVWDVHSDVALALLNNVVNTEAVEFLRYTTATIVKSVFVAPDAGAIKRVSKCAKEFNADVVRADKIRDTKTGNILETKVYSDHVGDKDFLIIDDICDGGRTFIELAKVLRPLTNGKIYLYITHGIFSQGLMPFYGIIDAIYCPNIWSNITTSNILRKI